MILHSRVIALIIISLSFSLIACDSPEEKAAHFIERGNKLSTQKDYNKARLEYKNAAQIQPTNAEIIYKIALLDEIQGDLANAFGGFIKAEQQESNYSPALLKLAQYYIAAKKYNESAKRLESLLHSNTNNAEAHALHAMLLFHQGKTEMVEEEALQALQQDPNNATAFAVLANLYNKQGNLEKAITTTEQGIAKNPDELSLLFLKISLLESKNDIEGSVQTYKHIFSLQPENSGLRSNLTSFLVQKGKLDEAEKNIHDTITVFPNNLNAKQALVFFLNDYRGFEQAKNEILNFIKEDPKEESFSLWLAQIYTSHKKIGDADILLKEIISNSESEEIKHQAQTLLANLSFLKGDGKLTRELIDTILKKKPDDPDALLLQAHLSFNDGEYEDAALTLQLILRDNAADKKALLLLTKVLIEQDRSDLALDAINRLVAAMPNDELLLMMKADILISLDQTKEALNLYVLMQERNPNAQDIANNMVQLIADTEYSNPASLEKAEIIAAPFINSTNPMLLDTLAWVYFRQGKIKEADSLIQKVMKSIDSPSPQLYFHLGSILAAQGNTEEAKKALTIATKEKANYLGIKEAKKLLNTLEKGVNILTK